MAGRQKHAKKTYSETSPVRYQGKMYALYKPYMGEMYAREMATAMYRNWDNSWVKVYHKVNSDPLVVSYLSEKVPSAMQFLAYQLINETVSSVLLTRNETAGMVVYKYRTRGMPEGVVLELLYRVASVIGPSIPQFMQVLGNRTLSPDNIVNVVNEYVMKTPPQPRSRGGKGAILTAESIPSIYAGTATFSSDASVQQAMTQEMQEMEMLAR